MCEVWKTAPHLQAPGRVRENGIKIQSRPVVCPTCEGFRRILDANLIKCNECKGDGHQVLLMQRFQLLTTCRDCKGTGSIGCWSCKKTGIYRALKPKAFRDVNKCDYCSEWTCRVSPTPTILSLKGWLALKEAKEVEMTFGLGYFEDMQEGEYDTATSVIEFAKRLLTFQEKVEGLVSEWDELEDLRDTASPAVQEIVCKRFFGKKKKSEITPHTDFFPFILHVLVKIGGSGKTKIVLDRVGDKMKNVLKPLDYEFLKSDGKSILDQRSSMRARKNPAPLPIGTSSLSGLPGAGSVPWFS
jgi:hypothetical protein